MIKVYNRIIPFPCYKSLAMWPFVFVRRKVRMTDADWRHEGTHLRQQAELLIVGFVVLYVLFFGIELVRCGFDHERGQKATGGRSLWMRAYRSIPFEREAYWFQDDPEYLKHRKLFAWARM